MKSKNKARIIFSLAFALALLVLIGGCFPGSYGPRGPSREDRTWDRPERPEPTGPPKRERHKIKCTWVKDCDRFGHCTYKGYGDCD